MRIFNSDVYGLTESIFRSGYPMKTEIADFTDVAKELLEIDFAIADKNYDNPHIKRAIKLANAGVGHSSFLAGIVVQMDVEAPQYVWMQIERYQFFRIISSQSKMHRLTQMDMGYGYEEEKYSFRALENIKDYIQLYKDDKCELEDMLGSVPMGLELS